MTPKLPTLRALTAELRAMQKRVRTEAGHTVVLVLHPGLYGPEWLILLEGYRGRGLCFGREYVPGSVEWECEACATNSDGFTWATCKCNGSGRVSVPTPFDAVAAARRLLAAARDGGAR